MTYYAKVPKYKLVGFMSDYSLQHNLLNDNKKAITPSFLNKMNVYCKVQECRFKTSHTTKGHKCGKCHNYGHGQLECDNPELKERLREYWNEEMLENDKCNFINCSAIYRNGDAWKIGLIIICNGSFTSRRTEGFKGHRIR
mgnify:CR=1 FL=1